MSRYHKRFKGAYRIRRSTLEAFDCALARFKCDTKDIVVKYSNCTAEDMLSFVDIATHHLTEEYMIESISCRGTIKSGSSVNAAQVYIDIERQVSVSISGDSMVVSGLSNELEKSVNNSKLPYSIFFESKFASNAIYYTYLMILLSSSLLILDIYGVIKRLSDILVFGLILAIPIIAVVPAWAYSELWPPIVFAVGVSGRKNAQREWLRFVGPLQFIGAIALSLIAAVVAKWLHLN